MAVTVQNTASSATSGSAVTSYDFTPVSVSAGSNLALVVQLAWTGVPTGITVTWDPAGANQAMSQIVLRSTSTNSQTVALYGLVNPTVGASKIVRISWT